MARPPVICQKNESGCNNGSHKYDRTCIQDKLTTGVVVTGRNPSESPYLCRPKQLLKPLIDEVITNMSCSIVLPCTLARFLRQMQGKTGNVFLRHPASSGSFFNCMPVLVTGNKIHLTVATGRILPQYPVDRTGTFDYFLPICSSQRTQATDAVADGNLVSCLLSQLRLDKLFYCQPRF